MTAAGHSAGLIHVVAAAVTDGAGRTLIAQRPAGKKLAGGWEFPGGKVEPGETRVGALGRELHEELGITLSAHPRPLLRLRHAYPYGVVLLDMWVVSRYSGVPRGMDGQAIRWCTQEELEAAEELLPADRPVVRALRLPERLTAEVTRDYAVCDLDEAHEGLRLRGVGCRNASDAAAAVRRGDADFLAIRSSLLPAELGALCEAVDLPVFAQGIGIEEAWALGASGIHDF